MFGPICAIQYGYNVGQREQDIGTNLRPSRIHQKWVFSVFQVLGELPQMKQADLWRLLF